MLEKTITPFNGFVALLLALAAIGSIIFGGVSRNPIFIVCGILLFFIILKGLLILNPNEASVLTFFGKYVGTVKANGFFFVNPLYGRRKISLKARNFDSERLKVNDQRGNPILISAILVWRVSETYKAAFEVDNFEAFVRVQTDAAVRKLANSYSYDNFDDEGTNEISLRSGVNQVNDDLEREIAERLEIAGIEVMEARIGYLAYAEEIASAMLKRQQAEAIVAARHKIVEGAVSMVESAIEQLETKNIVNFDAAQRALMVSNLMVVLCSDKEAAPVVNMNR